MSVFLLEKHFAQGSAALIAYLHDRIVHNLAVILKAREILKLNLVKWRSHDDIEIEVNSRIFVQKCIAQNVRGVHNFVPRAAKRSSVYPVLDDRVFDEIFCVEVKKVDVPVVENSLKMRPIFEPDVL